MEIIREAALLAFLTKDLQNASSVRNSLTFQELFMNTRIEYSIDECRISARFTVNKKLDSLQQAVKTINKSLEVGYFSVNNSEIIYTDSFSRFKEKFKKSYKMIILTQIQKFSKILKKHLNVFEYFSDFQGRSLEISSNLAKISKQKYFSVVEYSKDKRLEFEEDVEFILRLIQAGLSDLIIPQGSMIRPYRRVKYYFPNHGQAFPFKNLSLMHQKSLDMLLTHLESLQKKGFIVKNTQNVRSCAFAFGDKVFIIPDVKFSELFHIKIAKPMNLKSLKEKNFIRSRFNSFTDLKLLQNSEIFTIVEIDKTQEMNFSSSYKEMILFKHDLIVEFYGVYTDVSKSFVVFEKHSPGNLPEFFKGSLQSTQLKIFSQFLQKILDFVEWVQDKPAKDFFLISSRKISFFESRLKIVPNIEIVKDYSQFPPDDLLFIVLSKNRNFCEALLSLIKFLQDDHQYEKFNLKTLGKALVLQFRSANYCDSRMVSEVFDVRDEMKLNEVKDILNFSLKEFELILFENLKLKTEGRAGADFNKIIFRYFFLLQVKNLIRVIKDWEILELIQKDPSSGLVLKQIKKKSSIMFQSIRDMQSSPLRPRKEPSLAQSALLVSESLTLSSSSTMRSLINEKIQESDSEQMKKIIKTIEKKFTEFNNEDFNPPEINLVTPNPSTSPSEHFSGTLNFNYIQKRGNELKTKYRYDFDDPKDFAENILNAQVIRVLREVQNPGSSEVFMIGRFIFSVLFEEKYKNINKKLLKARFSLHKYLKMTLCNRVYLKVSEDESKVLPKYVNLSHMMMNYVPSLRPAAEAVREKIKNNHSLKENHTEILPVKASQAAVKKENHAEILPVKASQAAVKKEDPAAKK